LSNVCKTTVQFLMFAAMIFTVIDLLSLAFYIINVITIITTENIKFGDLSRGSVKKSVI